MHIFLGADHRGYQLKERIKTLLTERHISFTDFGTDSEERVDYPDFAFHVAEKIGSTSQHNSDEKGILICGSGIGMDIAANKVRGVRAALAVNPYMGRQSREHNDANILVLPGMMLSETEALAIVEAFLDATFDHEEGHARRVQKIISYETYHE